MGKKAQALIISLWILAILVVLAVSIGHRVSMALRLARYQKDKVEALYLARAGMNRAIAEITSDDTADYDGLKDKWADNEAAFKDVSFGGGENKFATVSYFVESEYADDIVYGAQDEERKININTASGSLLAVLIKEECGVEESKAGEISDYILIWRGDKPDDDKIYETLGYAAKGGDFTNPEELMLVKDISSEEYKKLKDLITVYGDGKININTVSSNVLKIAARGIAKDLTYAESAADSVAGKIINLRESNGPFKENSEINISLTGEEETNIFNSLVADKIVYKSDNFFIEAAGNIGKIKSKANAVYSRKDKKVLYWHES